MRPTGAQPSLGHTALPGQPATPEPTSPSDYLISLVHPDLRDTCSARDEIYDAEVASVTCGPADLPFDYSLFGSVADMNAAFDEDVAGAETPPDPKSLSCSTGKHLTDYSLDGGQHFGRQNCREHTSSSGALYHVVEWTSEQFVVIGYMSVPAEGHTWDEIIQFWEESAGPIGLFE